MSPTYPPSVPDSASTMAPVWSRAAPTLVENAPAPAPENEARALFRGLPRHYDRLAALLSLGQDPRWRRALIDAIKVSRTDRVLDVATGTGLVAAALLARSGCSVVGVDQSPEMLSAARRRFGGRSARAGNITLLQAQAERLPFGDAEFDALTCTYLLRYVDDPRAVMRELGRVVKPGGRIAYLEFAVPNRVRARLLWQLYVRVGLPAAGALVSGDWYRVGRFLGPSISGFYRRHPLPRLLDSWHQAGLQDIVVRRMSLGGGVVISATRATAEFHAR